MTVAQPFRCCNWDVALEDERLASPVGLSSARNGLLASGSGYAMGKVNILRIVPGMIFNSLTLAGVLPPRRQKKRLARAASRILSMLPPSSSIRLRYCLVLPSDV